MYPFALDVIQAFAEKTGEPDVVDAVNKLRKELYSLRLRDAQMEAAEAAGIDNWCGWGEFESVDEETFNYDLPR